MTWATTGDVTLYTGLTATEAELAQAQFIVELFADTTEEASDAGNVTAKNLRLLKMAVAYQAGWITQRPDVFTSMDTTGVSQDQVTATWLHANAGILAPFAKRSIDRLSWKRIRGLRLRRRSEWTPSRLMNVTSAVMDDDDPRWQPMSQGGGGA